MEIVVLANYAALNIIIAGADRAYPSSTFFFFSTFFFL